MFVRHFEKKKNPVLDMYCFDVNIVLIGAGLITCKFGCTFDSRIMGMTSNVCGFCFVFSQSEPKSRP